MEDKKTASVSYKTTEQHHKAVRVRAASLNLGMSEYLRRLVSADVEHHLLELSKAPEGSSHE